MCGNLLSINIQVQGRQKSVLASALVASNVRATYLDYVTENTADCR